MRVMSDSLPARNTKKNQNKDQPKESVMVSLHYRKDSKTGS